MIAARLGTLFSGKVQFTLPIVTLAAAIPYMDLLLYLKPAMFLVSVAASAIMLQNSFSGLYFVSC